MSSGSRAADPFKNSLLEWDASCKVESWWSFCECLKEENGIVEVWFEVERVVESEEIAAIFEREREMWRCQEGEVVGSWAPGFCYPFGIKLWLHFIQKKKREKKKEKRKFDKWYLYLNCYAHGRVLRIDIHMEEFLVLHLNNSTTCFSHLIATKSFNFTT